MFFGAKIFAKQLIAAVMIIFGVANLAFDFGSDPSMTLAAYAFAMTLFNSAKLDMIAQQPRINVIIAREKDSDQINKG